MAAAQATGLWAAVSGHWLTPYTLEPVSWLAPVRLLVRWIRLRDDRLLLALGAVAGVAAMTKFHVLLVCAVMLLAVLAVGPRALLRRPLLWGGVGVGAVISAPTLWWQARHGLPQLKMTEVVAAESGPLYGGRGGIAVQLFVFAGVASAALALYGLVRLVRDRTAIIGESYIVAAYIDGYSTKYHLPAAFSPTRSYGYFPSPGDDVDTVLFLGDNGPTRLRPYFTDVRKLDDDDRIDTWLLTRPTESWDTLWPKVRTLAVM